MKTLKEKLRDRDELSGMHICLTEPCISEMCAGLGYDFLWIDTEHTAIDYQVLLYHLMGAKAGGTDGAERFCRRIAFRTSPAGDRSHPIPHPGRERQMVTCC